MLWNKTILPKQHKILKYFYFCDKEHPLGDKNGIVYYHRHVASEKLGRWLEPYEHVHHLDGDRSNNNSDNIVVLSASEHARKHHSFLKPISCANVDCRKVFTPHASHTRYCSIRCSKLSKFIPIDVEKLRDQIWKIPSKIIAKNLGISDSGLIKICRRNGIEKPPRGYWAKIRRIHPPRQQSKSSHRGLVHGTNTAYTKYACRCLSCTEAHKLSARISLRNKPI